MSASIHFAFLSWTLLMSSTIELCLTLHVRIVWHASSVESLIQLLVVAPILAEPPQYLETFFCLAALYCDGNNAIRGQRQHSMKSLINEITDFIVAAIGPRTSFAVIMFCYDFYLFKMPLPYFHQIIALVWFRNYRLGMLRQCTPEPHVSIFRKPTAKHHGTSMEILESSIAH